MHGGEKNGGPQRILDALGCLSVGSAICGMILRLMW